MKTVFTILVSAAAITASIGLATLLVGMYVLGNNETVILTGGAITLIAVVAWAITVIMYSVALIRRALAGKPEETPSQEI